MLETNSEKAFAVVIIVAALLLVYLLINMPTPTSEGYCTSDCTTKTVSMDYVDYPHFNAIEICGSGCLIESIQENIVMQGYTVTCKCCNCVGSNNLDLPDCEPPLGFIYNFLGRCK